MKHNQNENFFSISTQRKRNPSYKDSGLDDKILDALHNHRMKEIQRQVAKAELYNRYYPKNVLEKKDYGKIIAGQLRKYVPDIDFKLAELDKSTIRFNKKLLEFYKTKAEPVFVDPPVEPPVDVDPPEAPDGKFRWAEIVWWWPNRYMTAKEEENGVHFEGGVYHSGDPLWMGSFGAIGRFGLNPEQTPHNPSNNWISAPTVIISEANLRGRTLVAPLLTGDYWSKCWLNVRQTVFEFVSSEGPKFMLNEKTDSKIQFFLEGDDLYESKFVYETELMPAVQYHRSRNDTTIGVELEIKFDFQLEGEAELDVDQARIIMPQWNVKDAQTQ